VVNNAGTIRPTPLLEITPEQWDRVLRIHLYGTFYCTVEMVRRFLASKRSGKIINVTAPSAIRGVEWCRRLRFGERWNHRVHQKRRQGTGATQHPSKCGAPGRLQPHDGSARRISRQAIRRTSGRAA
jgi:NAD(P)-dependent dehydrogenase (short-subunit alcohol dehydrogenase family)